VGRSSAPPFRFPGALRNQLEAPPTVADRAAYLRAELAKPEGERVLLVPEVDQQQRPYKQ
jgi:hypothetical protein